jgi:hypothetical protein
MARSVAQSPACGAVGHEPSAPAGVEFADL